MVAIILTWFIAPVLTGLVSACIFLLVRTCVLRRRYAYTLSFWLFPLLVLITVFINIFFVFTKVPVPDLSAQTQTLTHTQPHFNPSFAQYSCC